MPTSAPPETDDGRRVGIDVVARHGRLVGRTMLVSGATLVSRVIGFFRESLAASLFGDSSPVNDAFVTAWRVPNLFRSLLGEGAISTSMQTALTRADAEEGEAAGRALFVAILRVVAWLSLAVCALAMVVAWLLPDVMPVTGWHWLGEEPGPVRELTVRMLPFVAFVCLSAVVGGALQVRGHFLTPSLAPAVMNVGWIAALFLVGSSFGWLPISDDAALEYARQLAMARQLAWFALVAGALLVGVQVPALVRERLLFARPPGAAARVSSVEVWRILRVAAPLALGAAAYQVNVLVDGWMAIGMLPEGGPSLLYYATRIQQFPMSLVAIAATSAVFPALSALGHRGRLDELRELHDRTHLAIAFVALPASLGLFVFAEPVFSVCFEHGAFGAEGVRRASAGLRALSLAVLPVGAAGLVARTYYALGDFTTPVRISIAMVLVHVALSLLFVGALGMDLEGFALATALAAWGNLVCLLPGLTGRLGLPRSTLGFARRLATVAGASAASLLLARGVFALLGAERSSVGALFLAIGVAVAGYAALSHVLRIPEWQHLLARGAAAGGGADGASGKRKQSGGPKA